MMVQSARAIDTQHNYKTVFRIPQSVQTISSSQNYSLESNSRPAQVFNISVIFTYLLVKSVAGGFSQKEALLDKCSGVRVNRERGFSEKASANEWLIF